MNDLINRLTTIDAKREAELWAQFYLAVPDGTDVKDEATLETLVRSLPLVVESKYELLGFAPSSERDNTHCLFISLMRPASRFYGQGTIADCARSDVAFMLSRVNSEET